MNILRPVRFDGIMQHGGSTRPWIVTLSDDSGNESPYVVKLFTTRNIEQQHAVAKEVYGNLLAREFDLPAPEMGLVHFTPEFIEDVLDEEHRTILAEKDPGLKFACKLEDRLTIVSPVLYPQFLKQYDMANVYAFDCLIFNIDRGGQRNKPNLLVDDESFVLIDHEQCFPFADNLDGFYERIKESIQAEELLYPFQNHLFYPYLKKLRPQGKKQAFDEFGVYLERLNLDNILLEISRLKELGVSTGYDELIVDYLRMLRKNPHKFCKILVKSIC